jgi:hypothetical protein
MDNVKRIFSGDLFGKKLFAVCCAAFAVLIAGGAHAAVKVRPVGGAGVSSAKYSAAATSSAAKPAAVKRTFSPTRVSSVKSSAIGSSSSVAAKNARLSVGRLYNSSGKLSVNPSKPGGGTSVGAPDLSDYALQSQVNTLETRVDGVETRLDGRVDSLEERIDDLVISGGGLPEAPNDGIYVVEVKGGKSKLKEMDLVTGEYQGL